MKSDEETPIPPEKSCITVRDTHIGLPSGITEKYPFARPPWDGCDSFLVYSSALRVLCRQLDGVILQAHGSLCSRKIPWPPTLRAQLRLYGASSLAG